MTSDPSSADASPTDGGEDLFGKLDQLLSRHQVGPGRANRLTPPPVLTDAVDNGGGSRAQTSGRGEDGIPVLHDAVEEDDQFHDVETAALRRRQLQAALYLRLRQRLDEQLALASTGAAPDEELAQFARRLRNALPEIVRTSVEQVFAPAEGGNAV